MNALRNCLIGSARHGLTVVLAFVFGFLGSQAATIVSARGGDGGLINACVQNRSGEIRIVAANDACRRAEYHLNWNVGGGPTPGSLSGLEVVWNSASQESNPTLTVGCPAGKKAIAGGEQTLAPSSIWSNRPVGPNIGEPYYVDGVPTGVSGTSTLPDGWIARYTGNGQMLAVYAVCVTVNP